MSINKTFKNLHDKLSTEYTVHKIFAERSKDPVAGWSEYERKSIEYSNDPKAAELRRKVEEYRIEQMLLRAKERKLEAKKRWLSDLEVKTRFAHVNEQTINAVIEEYGLQSSPAGKLAACRILEAEGRTDKPEPTDLTDTEVSEEE